MNKPIEERVKKIIEENETLSIKQKGEIICLIECYKGADVLVQQFLKAILETKEKLIDLKKFIRNEIDYFDGASEVMEELAVAIHILSGVVDEKTKEEEF